MQILRKLITKMNPIITDPSSYLIQERIVWIYSQLRYSY